MNVVVYCSAKDSIPEEYKHLGDVLGRWLAEHGHNLVYGGATGGIMTRVSESFIRTAKLIAYHSGNKKERPQLIGVAPEVLQEAGRLSTNCDQLIMVADLAERKRKMRELADLFLCLPGSYGTLDEMYDAIASATIGEHKKPVFVWNYEGFYNGLKQQIEHMRSLDFLPKNERHRLHFRDTWEDVVESLEYWNQKIQNRQNQINN